MYRSGVRVHLHSSVGAQVDGASFSALTPGTGHEWRWSTAGPLRAVAASATGWTREWAWGWGGRRAWSRDARGGPPPACRPGPAWGQEVACSPPAAPVKARGKLLVSMPGRRCRGQPGWARGPTGHGLPRAALRGWAPVPRGALGPDHSTARAWTPSSSAAPLELREESRQRLTPGGARSAQAGGLPTPLAAAIVAACTASPRLRDYPPRTPGGRRRARLSLTAKSPGDPAPAAGAGPVAHCSPDTARACREEK